MRLLWLGRPWRWGTGTVLGGRRNGVDLGPLRVWWGSYR